MVAFAIIMPIRLACAPQARCAHLARARLLAVHAAARRVRPQRSASASLGCYRPALQQRSFCAASTLGRLQAADASRKQLMPHTSNFPRNDWAAWNLSGHDRPQCCRRMPAEPLS